MQDDSILRLSSLCKNDSISLVGFVSYCNWVICGQFFYSFLLNEINWVMYSWKFFSFS